MAWRIAQVSAVFAAVALVVVAGWGTYSWMLESVARADAAREASRPGCAEWRVRIADVERYDYRAEHITHLHEMGPILGPGEG